MEMWEDAIHTFYNGYILSCSYKSSAYRFTFCRSSWASINTGEKDLISVIFGFLANSLYLSADNISITSLPLSSGKAPVLAF